MPTEDDSPVREEPTFRSRVFGFNVGWLFAILLAVVAAFFGTYRWSISSRIAQIKRIGGTVTVGPPPFSYELRYSSTTPACLHNISTSRLGQWGLHQFPHVYEIDLRGVSSPSDVESALRVGSSFDSVLRLTLYKSAVVDRHLSMVATDYPRLTHLKINETAITDAGIGYLRDHPRLELVNAQRTSLTDAAVPDLASLPRLKELNIAGTGISSIKPILDVNPRCKINQELITKSKSSDYYSMHGR